jgi:hypothetical protein
MKRLKEFKSARSRLDRAKEHGEKLAKLWNEIPNKDFFRLRSRAAPDGSGYLFVEGVKPLPDEFSLLLGELLYQLRSALDACVYQATIYATKQDPPPDEGQLEFPICSNSADFEKQARRRLSKLKKSTRGAIEKVQPYNMPNLSPEKMVTNFNRSLQILNDLARKDRHRKLHVVGAWPMKVHPKFVLPFGREVDVDRYEGRSSSGGRK